MTILDDLVFRVPVGGAVKSVNAEAMIVGTADVVSVVFAPSEDWLHLAPLTGNTPFQVNISVDATGLPPGTYTATIPAQSIPPRPYAVPVVTLIVQDLTDFILSIFDDVTEIDQDLDRTLNRLSQFVNGATAAQVGQIKTALRGIKQKTVKLA